jgi:cyclin-dependent kinase 8/11
MFVEEICHPHKRLQFETISIVDTYDHVSCSRWLVDVPLTDVAFIVRIVSANDNFIIRKLRRKFGSRISRPHEPDKNNNRMRRHALNQKRQQLTDKYKLIGKIGEGTYGLVYKAELASRDRDRNDDDEQSFAVKMIKSHKEGKNDVVLSIATVREIKILREMHHDNVVHLHDVHVDPKGTSLALVFDYADHDLRDIIVQSKQKPLTEYTKKSFMHQILKGVKYMHDNWVMHRDLKPQNILVVGHGRRRGQVKLADFGLARIYKDPIKALTDVERVVVTLWYRAPELLLGAKHYTKAVDMWSVGCIFAEILNTRELFCGKEAEGTNAPFQKDQCDKIFKVMGLPTPQTWEGVEHLPEYENMLNMCKEREYPMTSKLHEYVKFGSGSAAVLLRDMISRMLHYGTIHLCHFVECPGLT